MTNQKALNEFTDMLAGPKIGEQWVQQDADTAAGCRAMVSNLQIYLCAAAKRSNSQTLRCAIDDLLDAIDDNRAALDMLPDLIDEARRDTAEANGQFGVGA